MAIKELFYDNRPQVLLDPRASQRIDPRFKFTRNGTATYIDRFGNFKTATNNEPRFNPEDGALLLEPSRINVATYSEQFNQNVWDKFRVTVSANAAIAPDGSTTADKIIDTTQNDTHLIRRIQSGLPGNRKALSIFAKKAEYDHLQISAGINGVYTAVSFDLTNGSIDYVTGSEASSAFRQITPLANGWFRCSFVPLKAGGYIEYAFLISPTSSYTFAGTGSSGLFLWGAQLESEEAVSSYVRTPSTSAATRAADLLSVEAPLPASGSVYIDARAITANENDTLLSIKNSSNDKIDLAYLSNASTYNSLALIANYDGTSKTSLPLPVPTTDRERNIITWGANNYQYTRDSSRYAASLSSSVPTGLNQLSIGHDAVDPTKAFNGYINTVYAWSGELTPAVAEALVRNDLDPINADTYSPVGPAGSLALVINTQGASTSGDKSFTLPAESAANDNDIVITWGDGTESGLDGTDAEVGSAALTHTYPAAGIYPVWVEGQMQNIYFNNIANAPDLLQIAAWGTGDMFTAPSTMQNAFYGCSQMDFSASARTTNLPDTSAVTNWSNAFNGCSSITGTFPAFNFSAALTFFQTWGGCSSMTAFPTVGDQTQNVQSFYLAWYNCSSLIDFPQINTSAGIDFYAAWLGCSNILRFPLITTNNATNLSGAWYNCSKLDNIANAGEATSFPLINTSKVTNFGNTWRGCAAMTVFPAIDTSQAINLSGAWASCTNLTVMPDIITTKVTDMNESWIGCSSLVAFPQIDGNEVLSLNNTWNGCSQLQSFPSINFPKATSCAVAWNNCNSLEKFPLIDLGQVENFAAAWAFCSSLDNIVNDGQATSFPVINTSSGQNFSRAWVSCSSMTVFPSLDFDNAVGLATDTVDTGFKEAWRDCSSLATFPPNMFNASACTRYVDAFFNCALTAASIENIIVSIEAAGTSNGNLSLQGGTNAGASTWTAAAVTAYDALVARGWTITRNA